MSANVLRVDSAAIEHRPRKAITARIAAKFSGRYGSAATRAGGVDG
jgi:hypothetical protein